VTSSPDIPAVEKVLRDLVAEYYEGCKAYAAACAFPATDGARIFWRTRLDALSDYGSQLAEALGVAEPDWEHMSEVAKGHQEPVKPILYPGGPCDGCGSPGPAGEACG
jgi:hypothetical protein